MRTITITLKAELQFGAVAAACPPALPVPQQVSVWSPVQQKQSDKQAGTGTGTSGFAGGTARGIASVIELGGALGASAALGAAKAQSAEFAGAGNIAEPGSLLAAAKRTDLYRPFHTMSRRDPRSWRPPHSD